jgi:hypothetical protein
MKAQILKLGGVTTEAEFYKKFPTEKAFMAKHGKKLEKLKKAQGGGFVPSDIPADAFNPQMPFDPSSSSGTKGGFGGIDKFINSDIGGTVSSSSSSSSNKKGFDYGSLVGPTIEAIQEGQANSAFNKKLDQYLGISDLISKIPPKKQQKPDYIRPQLVTGATPKGIPAKNGAMIGGNPTEIQNMYTSGDIYTDLEDTNPKQYGWGGELANVNAGWNNDGVTGNMSPGWKAASTAASFIPLVGQVVEFMGQTEANEQAGMQAKKQTPFFNNLAASAIQNVNSGQFSANLKYGGSIDSMEEGGWVSNDWQPQVIATFGEHKLKDLLKPPHDADMLRAGGHLKYYTPPSAEAMNTDRAEYGAELQTLWGGDIKDGGVNPYIGPLGMLSGAQHSERAPDAIGKNGIGIKFGNNVIEAENREGIAMLTNGGEIDPATGKPGKSAYIFGAEKIQGWAKKAIEDPDIKIGTTFKHWFDSKSKLQKKLNKQELDITEQIANLDVDDSYEQLKMNALMRMKDGIDMQNLDLAKYIGNGAAVQTAINETDEEMGTAKYGKKLKKAAFGAKMTTAQNGKSLDPNDTWINKILDYEYQSGSSTGTGLKNWGYNSRNPKTKQEAIKYFKQDYLPKVKQYPLGLRERAADYLYNTGRSFNDLLLYNAGKINLDDINSPKTFDKEWQQHKPEIESMYSNPDFINNLDQSKLDVYRTTKPIKDALGNKTTNPQFDATWKNRVGIFGNYSPAADIAQKAPIAQANQLGRIDDEDIVIENKNVRRQAPVPVAYSPSSSQFPSPTDEEGNYYMPNSEYTPIEQPINQMPAMQQQAQAPLQQPFSKAGNSSSKWLKGLETVGNNVLTGIESALPYLRPSNQRPMDPEAFTGEMFALATNQLEPVKAQKFVPYLTQGIQISLQDQMNEVTAQTRAAERLARGNPEALAIIAAQAYDAKNKIKGEEFRLNQGEKQRVAETNRQVLNEANRVNLGIMDEQYVRQQTAKSKTKEQAITALKSISNKILQNKLENKQLGIYENLYGFRFGPNGQAYNTNITTFNTPTVNPSSTALNDLTIPERQKAIEDAKKAKIAKTATKGQGGIVKSMHEL